MRNTLAMFDRTNPIWNFMGDLDEMFEHVAPTRDTKVIPYDMQEGENGYLLSVDLPGVTKDDLKIEIADQVLTLSGERKRAGEGQKFMCRFSIPETADATKIEANLENGVLEIGIPKKEAAKPRAIQIETGKQGLFSKLLGSMKEKTNKQESERTVQAS